jgi:hypothetical protein
MIVLSLGFCTTITKPTRQGVRIFLVCPKLAKLLKDYIIHRVPEYLSVPSSELGPPTPPSQASVSSPWNQRGGATLACGGPNLDDWRESLALCLLCGPDI